MYQSSNTLKMHRPQLVSIHVYLQFGLETCIRVWPYIMYTSNCTQQGVGVRVGHSKAYYYQQLAEMYKLAMHMVTLLHS